MVLNPGDYFAVPMGIEHKPVTITDEVEIILFEPPEVVNTGNQTESNLTKKTLQTL